MTFVCRTVCNRNGFERFDLFARKPRDNPFFVLFKAYITYNRGDERAYAIDDDIFHSIGESRMPDKLSSAQLTAEWEQRLGRIEQGQEKAEDFMRDIRQFVDELAHDTKRAKNAEQLFPPLREALGACPKCGAAITERAKGYMCENRTCSFALWKTGGILKDAEKPLTSGDVKELLEKGCVRKVGLRSAKTHTQYAATLHLDYNADGKPILRPTFD